MKDKIKLLFRLIFLILYVRPTRWKYEIDKLKKHKN
jgi:hypothetical protein